MMSAFADGDKETAKKESARFFKPKGKQEKAPMKDRNYRTSKFIDEGEKWKKVD